jgi:hypothetical protein
MGSGGKCVHQVDEEEGGQIRGRFRFYQIEDDGIHQEITHIKVNFWRGAKVSDLAKETRISDNPYKPAFFSPLAYDQNCEERSRECWLLGADGKDVVIIW